MPILPDPSPTVRTPDERTGDMLRGRVVGQPSIALAKRVDLHRRVAAFLVSPAAAAMTGDTVHVDGGVHHAA